MHNSIIFFAPLRVHLYIIVHIDFFPYYCATICVYLIEVGMYQHYTWETKKTMSHYCFFATFLQSRV